ncbi:MAG: hypothetical protein H7Z10_12945 [Gemmatimonadaceae bacterium]|nr:hypothetical protein [Acetobacteraceae bacterium]
MLGAAVSGPDGSKRFVVVERLPSGAGWDWLAWQATPERRCLHGLAGSRADAMRAAETAVQQLAGPVACPAG